MRFSAPSSTSGVQTPEPVACQSAPAQAARLARARRPRRLTPLPWPSPRGLRERAPARCAWRKCRGLCDGFFEVGIAVGTQRTPPSCPSLVLVAEVRDCASCPFGRRLAPPCFVHGQAFQGAIEDGAGKSGARLRLDAALEAAEDGHVAGLQV